MLAGDFNVVPTDEDIYNPRSWLKDALLQPESRERYQRLARARLDRRAANTFGDERVYTFWGLFPPALGHELRLTHRPSAAERRPRAALARRGRRPLGCGASRTRAIMAPTWVELEMGAARRKKKRRIRGWIKR
ncbi:hypothetical protein ACFFYR_08315 [Paraburkholderia dipogonis]|uniref:hypothetical protein n=1 Tax=Paraburkholderia dipogonis TaxID=1211383 RepID=UPI0035E78E57